MPGTLIPGLGNRLGTQAAAWNSSNGARQLPLRGLGRSASVTRPGSSSTTRGSAISGDKAIRLPPLRPSQQDQHAAHHSAERRTAFRLRPLIAPPGIMTTRISAVSPTAPVIARPNCSALANLILSLLSIDRICRSMIARLATAFCA